MSVAMAQEICDRAPLGVISGLESAAGELPHSEHYQ